MLDSRRPSPRRGMKDDRGAVAVLFALFMVVFMILLAFVVDLGQVYANKAQLQNAVDAAALAGAGVVNCAATNTAAAQTEAALYGSSYNGTPVTVVVTGTTVRAAASTTVRTPFGAFVGRSSTDVLADATASKDCNGGYAAFAGTASFDSSGGVTITGSVYSGAQAKFSGRNDVSGNIDVVGGSCQGSCKDENNDNLVISNVPAKAPACYAYEIGLDGNGGSACAPTRTANTGLIQSVAAAGPTLSGSTAAACTINATWFTTNPTIRHLNCGSRDVTIQTWNNTYPLALVQTSGRIIFAGSFAAGNSEPNRSTGSATNAVTLYTTNTAGDAIEIQGNNSMNHFGYLYAPAGSIEANGNGNLQWVGTMIARGIDINGTGSGGGTTGFLAAAGVPRLTE